MHNTTCVTPGCTPNLAADTAGTRLRSDALPPRMPASWPGPWPKHLIKCNYNTQFCTSILHLRLPSATVCSLGLPHMLQDHIHHLGCSKGTNWTAVLSRLALCPHLRPPSRSRHCDSTHGSCRRQRARDVARGSPSLILTVPPALCTPAHSPFPPPPTTLTSPSCNTSPRYVAMPQTCCACARMCACMRVYGYPLVPLAGAFPNVFVYLYRWPR